MMLYENPVYMTYGKLNDLVNIIFYCFINLVWGKKSNRAGVTSCTVEEGLQELKLLAVRLHCIPR